MKNKPAAFIGLLIVLLFVSVPIFFNLDHYPIMRWDEARQAISALEMHNTGNWIVSQYDCRPDMWNTKPPLLIWLQVLMMHIVGSNEWAVRLPIAFAAIGICLILYWLFAFKYKKPWLGIIVCMVLITSQGFVTYHGIRTGDYDTLLTFFIFAYSLSFFFYIEEDSPKYLLGAFLFLTGAVLTKGVAGLLFTPGIFIYALYRKKIAAILKEKSFYTGAGFFILLGMGFYTLREHYNPGYLNAIRDNELGGRFGNALENHKGVFLFYFNCIYKHHFHYWYLLLLPGFIAGIASKSKWLRHITAFSGITLLAFFLIISIAQTKLFWYGMPMYPYLSVISGVFIYLAFNWLRSLIINKHTLLQAIPYILLAGIFIYPYYKTVKYIEGVPMMSPALQPDEDMAYFLMDVLHHKQALDNCTISWDGYEPAILWYVKALNMGKHNIQVVANDKYGAISKVAAFKTETKKYIEHVYNAQLLYVYHNVTIYKLNGFK